MNTSAARGSDANVHQNRSLAYPGARRRILPGNVESTWMPLLVTSRQNARVRDLRAAFRGRAADGFAAVEGSTLLQEALASSGAGMRVETVFLREDRHTVAQELPTDVDVVLLSADVFDSAVATEQSQGVAALMRKPLRAYQPAVNDLVIVASGLQDPGNLGTLIRSAEALGAAAVLLAEQTVDPWNNKALRASAGSVFRMPLPRWSDRMLQEMRDCGIRLLAAVPAGNGTLPASSVDLCTGSAFFIGNEGNGLSPAMLALCDGRITLPMPGATESLNAAVAGSLLLYEASRQRLAKDR